MIKYAPSIKRLHKQTPEFWIGFEFEGYVRWSHIDNFHDEIYNIDHGIDIGDDSSIENPDGYEPVEIRTPALPLKDGLVLLNQMLTFLEAKKAKRIWGTNRSCGLHINISERNIFSNDIASQKFYCRMLTKFHQKRIARMFGRSKNDFCQTVPIKKAWKKNFDKLFRDFRKDDEEGSDRDYFMQDKYLAMAYREGERIEFRCLGNSSYELKRDKIQLALNHIFDCANKSYVECVNDPYLTEITEEQELEEDRDENDDF